MTRVLLIRHARTAWNDEKRIQGHTDVPLSDAGRAEVGGRRLPDIFCRWPVFVSPLKRAVETARLLQLEAAVPDERLKEMHYGAWEGSTWAELIAAHGDVVAARARQGIDFRPDGGESPKELRTRLVAWLDEVRASGQSVVAVTHKGVIRMALAMATGWDLMSRAPETLFWDHAHLFTLPDAPGSIEIAELNLALEAT